LLSKKYFNSHERICEIAGLFRNRVKQNFVIKKIFIYLREQYIIEINGIVFYTNVIDNPKIINDTFL